MGIYLKQHNKLKRIFKILILKKEKEKMMKKAERAEKKGKIIGNIAKTEIGFLYK